MGKTKTKRRPKRGALTAATADRHSLYEQSVQCPEADCEFFDEAFKRAYGRKATTLREDFCGTAFLSRTWVELRKKNRAIGIDLDEPTLQYARDNHMRKLGHKAERVELIRADVNTVTDPKVEIIAAMNFSYLVFTTRSQLRAYFEKVHASLQKEGLFILDLYGGPESMVVQEEETEYDDYSYVWDQAEFNPITHEAVCHIHFNFPGDGGSIERAFTYEWRLWTIPEVREVLEEAGFHDSVVFWEGTGADGEGNGEFKPSTTGDDSSSFIVYIVAKP